MKEEKANEKNLTQQDNQILISFVNDHFGPIRGLNFISKDKKKLKLKSTLKNNPPR